MKVLWLIAVSAVVVINAVESQGDWGWRKDRWHKHPGPPFGHPRGPHGFHGGPHGFHGGYHGFHKGPHGYHKYRDDEDSREDSKDSSKEGSSSSGEKVEKNADGCSCDNTNNSNEQDTSTSSPPLPQPAFRKDISDDPEKAFQDLASEVIANDQLYSKYCKKNTITGVTEIYGTDSYKLIIPLGDNDPENVIVKIRHRILYVKFKSPEINARWNADTEDSFSYIRALPALQDISKTTWDIKNLKLEITSPYKFILNSEMPPVCDAEVNTREITVPRGGQTGDGKDNKLNPQKDEEATEKPKIDTNILDKIFGKQRRR